MSEQTDPTPCRRSLLQRMAALIGLGALAGVEPPARAAAKANA